MTYFYVIFALSLILSSTSFPLLFERNIFFSLISNELLPWEPVLAFVLCYTGIIAVSCSVPMLVVFDWLLKKTLSCSGVISKWKHFNCYH